jgi:anti-sigma factor RsiW
MMKKWPHDRSEDIRDQLLLDYVDGRLEPAVLARLQQHLAECPVCREKIEANQAFMDFRDAQLARNHQMMPSAGFADRLKQQIKNESMQPAKNESMQPAKNESMQPAKNETRQPVKNESRQTVNNYSFSLKPAGRFSLVSLAPVVHRYSRMSAAAILVILISVGGLITYQIQQKNNLTLQLATATPALQSTGQMAAEAAIAGSGTVSAAAQDSLMPGQQSATGANQAGESPSETSAEARLFGKAGPTPLWRDAWTENMILPLRQVQDPDLQVFTNDLISTAKAAIWVEPDRLIVACPTEAFTAQLKRLAALSPGYDPEISIESIEEDALKAFLENQLGTTTASDVAGLLFQPDCRYLMMTIGGN